MVTLIHDLESNEDALGAACGAPPTRAGPTTVGARELFAPTDVVATNVDGVTLSLRAVA